MEKLKRRREKLEGQAKRENKYKAGRKGIR